VRIRARQRTRSRIETPAAAAARALAKRVKGYPPGFYAVVDDPAEVPVQGPAVSDMGVFAGMRVLVGERTVLGPTQPDRVALARYAMLMYQRAPATEAAMTRWGIAYDRGAQAAIDELMPGRGTGLEEFIGAGRARMVDRAHRIGRNLASANWWACAPRRLTPSC
jgi:hypothetical protein